MRPRVVTFAIVAGAMCVLAGSAAVADSPSSQPFDPKISSLPAEAVKPPQPSLYDELNTADTSPLGTQADSVVPEDLFALADAFLNGTGGHAVNLDEAAYWLKRAIAVAPDPTGKLRGWAVGQLGVVIYKRKTGDNRNNHAVARQLWEVAGAWNDPGSLCFLGFLAEKGDGMSNANPKAALVWYERAKIAGCQEADADIARLKR